MVVPERRKKGDEFHCLDKSKWKEVVQQRGPDKGQPPRINKAGLAFVGNPDEIEEIRVFKKEKSKE